MRACGDGAVCLPSSTDAVSGCAATTSTPKAEGGKFQFASPLPTAYAWRVGRIHASYRRSSPARQPIFVRLVFLSSHLKYLNMPGLWSRFVLKSKRTVDVIPCTTCRSQFCALHLLHSIWEDATRKNNTAIKFLDLSWNKLSGRLPSWIGDLGNLGFVLLSHNTFSGNIPIDITSLRNLQYLDLSCNNFSGAIPGHLSNLTLMKIVQEEFMPTYDARDGEDNSLEVGAGHLAEIFSVVTKGQKLLYGTALVYFVSIDLSCNSLTGEVPTDITSLAALMNLNLSSNRLSGQIPNMIGAMQSLVSLDLSENKLSGEIPWSLSSLASLTVLNMSYNNLSGRIPSGRQLDTLNSDNPSIMYIGNNGLCGPPLHNNCSGNDSFIIRSDLGSGKQEFDPPTFHFGLVLGLVVGLWMVFCAMLFKKTWRNVYFRLFDKAYDQVYVFVVVKWASFAKKTTTE